MMIRRLLSAVLVCAVCAASPAAQRGRSVHRQAMAITRTHVT